jgi:large subunit ribosomal protein L15
MEQFDIRKPHGATRRKKILGRGAGSGRGSTAGRGSKGQNSRSGGKTRIGFEGGQMPLYRRIARRGFSNYPFKTRFTTVDVGALEVFSNGEKISRQSLVDRRIVRPKVGLIKILGNGTLSKKLTVEVDKVTAGARKIIEAAGGTVIEAGVKAAGKPAAKPSAAKKPKAEVSQSGGKNPKAAKAKSPAERAGKEQEKPSGDEQASKVEPEDSEKEKDR